MELPTLRFQWTWRDAVLYALGVGCDPGAELDYVYERRGPQVLPTFPVLAGGKMMDTLPSVVELDLRRLLHGTEAVSVLRPLPPEGDVEIRGRISEVWDKGKAAVIEVETAGYDDEGLLFTVHGSLYVNGAGGFGGERGPSAASAPVPERAPDYTVCQQIPHHQAALYRLSGDRNPMHIDPDFARAAGFDGPFLHGLCTFGFVGRAVLQSICGADLRAFAGLSGRFVGQVWPGDELVTTIWATDDVSAALQTTSSRGAVVIANGQVTLRAPE
ncbi:MAG: MaoC/PaaZ C-terminal domain-containing protein [Acidimicrobiales bacterium]